MSTNTDDTVNAAPFVDDTDDKDVKDAVDDENSDNQSVDPDSKEGVEAENKAQSSESDDQNDIDSFLSKIKDEVINRLIERMADDDDNSKTSSINKDDADTERKSAMSYGVRKRADDESKPDKTLSPEEVLDQTPDQGIAFEKVKNDDLTESEIPGSANVGDNLDGSQKNPGDVDDTNDTVVKPRDNSRASTASIAHLVDQFIKAGVYNEDERWAKIDELSNSSAIKVKTASAVIDLVSDAQKEKSEKFAKLAMRRSARINAAKCADDGTKVDDDEMKAEPSPVDPDTDDDDKKDDTKTSAIIDKYGTVRGIVVAHNGEYAWRLMDASKRASGRRMSGVGHSMSSAIHQASVLFGSKLSEATAINAISASKRRASRVAKTRAMVKRTSNTRRLPTRMAHINRTSRPETLKLAKRSAVVDDTATALL